LAKQKFKHHLIYYAARALLFILGLLPSGLVRALGRWFGALVFALAGRERGKTLNSIRTAFPKNFSDEQAQNLARAVWVRLGQNLFEAVRWLKWPSARIAAQVVRSRGWEQAEKALTRNKGVLIVTAHLGNWELLASYLSSRHPVSAVAQNLYDPRFDELMTDFRENHLGVSMIKRGMALRGILDALKRNRLVIALCDQDTGKDGVFVPFFGKPAWTQSGIARIAQKTGAAILPAFVIRGADGQFEFHMEREIPLPQTGDKEKDVVETVRRYTEAIESYVKAYPDQWMWMHERWKTRPENEKSES
jgi:Kdo2-lipid IVA lauroyltransferase/acyltransferase